MAWSFIKEVGQAASSVTGTTLSVTVPAGGCAIGSTLICGVATNNAPVVSSATDSGSNTYTVDRTQTLALVNTSASLVSAYLTTALTSGQTITFTFSATTHGAATVTEWAGGPSTGRTDQFSSDGGETAITDGIDTLTTAALAATDDLMVAVVGYNSTGTLTDTTSGMTTRTAISSTGTIRKVEMRDKVLTASAGVSYVGTLSADREWSAIVGTYKLAAGGGGGGLFDCGAYEA